MAVIDQLVVLDLQPELALQMGARNVGGSDLFGRVRKNPLVVRGEPDLGGLYGKLVVVLQRVSTGSSAHRRCTYLSLGWRQVPVLDGRFLHDQLRLVKVFGALEGLAGEFLPCGGT